MTTPSKGSLNELEEKITALESSNFDLKMQLYYQTQKMNENNSKVESEEVVVLDESDNKDWELLQLREEQEYSRRRMKELEEEILQLQIIRDSDIEKAAKQKPVNMILIDENRRQEREAAAAIAAHDAAVIKQLQSDIFAIQKQHEIDKQLVNDCAQKLAQQLQTIDEKDTMIFTLSGSLEEMKKTVSEVLSVNNKKSTDSTPGKKDSDEKYSFDDANDGNNSISEKSSNQQQNTTVKLNGMDISHAYYRNEIDRIRNENEVLREQLRTQKESINNQQEALLKLNRTQHEMKVHLESAEISRLQGELDKCIEEKESLVHRNQSLENEILNLREQIAELKHSNNHHPPVAPVVSDNEHLETIEMYKQREIELLNALEGVVNRCQELEGQLSHIY